ncbi:MAG: hypothetical protein RIM99_01820 [Cyclobacteriaceae bacterium]
MVFKKDLSLQKEWVELLYKIKELTGKRPTDLNAVLFLVGVQELGRGNKTFSKEEKQDLMHIAICKVLSLAGYYKLEGTDTDGWPHWKLVKKLPGFDILEQEKLLKIQIIQYFKEEIGW